MAERPGEVGRAPRVLRPARDGVFRVLKKLDALVGVHPGRTLWGIFLLAWVVRLLALALTHKTTPAGDEIEYLLRAGGAVLGAPWPEDHARAPGILFFYESLFRVFGAHALVAKLANTGVSALTVFPVVVLGRGLGGPRVGTWAALGVALYPNYIAFSHSLWPAPLYILFVTGGLALLVSGREKASPGGWLQALAAGLLLGASALIKESGLAFLPCALLWIVFVDRRAPALAWRRAALVGVAAAAVVLPWTLHIQEAGQPLALITRTGYMNLFIGSHPAGHGVAMTEYARLADTQSGREAVARERAFAAIEARGLRWPFEKFVREVPRFFTPTSFAVRRLLASPNDPGGWRYRLSPTAIDRDGLRVLLVVGVVGSYGAALMLGAFGLVMARRTDISGLLGLFLLSQILPSVVTFSMSRFRLAGMVCFLLGAAYAAIHGRAAWYAAPPWRRGVAVAVVVGLMALMGLDYTAVLESTGR